MCLYKVLNCVYACVRACLPARVSTCVPMCACVCVLKWWCAMEGGGVHALMAYSSLLPLSGSSFLFFSFYRCLPFFGPPFLSVAVDGFGTASTIIWVVVGV